VLEVLTAILAALLNLSTLVANQPKIAKRGIMVLLKTNSSLFQLVSNKVMQGLGKILRLVRMVVLSAWPLITAVPATAIGQLSSVTARLPASLPDTTAQ
jgi:hypothetical protein